MTIKLIFMHTPKTKTLLLTLMIIAAFPLKGLCQVTVTTVSTAGLKYPLLEAAMGTWARYCPDADQDWGTIKTAYPVRYPYSGMVPAVTQ